MKKMNVFASYLLLLSIVFVSCGKDPENPGTSGEDHSEDMKYVASLKSSGEEIKFTYNDKKQLIQIQYMENNKLTFEYGEKTMTYYGTDIEGDELYKTTLQLDANGYVSSATATNGAHWDVSYSDGYISRTIGDDMFSYDIKAGWFKGNMIEIIDENEQKGTAEYGVEKNNKLINIDLNWILKSVEVWDFAVNNRSTAHTIALFAMGYYGKRSENMKTKITDAPYGRETNIPVYLYTYEKDSNGFITKIIQTPVYQNGRKEEYMVTYL